MSVFLFFCLAFIFIVLLGRISVIGGVILAVFFIVIFLSNNFISPPKEHSISAFPIEILKNSVEGFESPTKRKKPRSKTKVSPTFSVNLTLENNLLKKLENGVNMKFNLDGEHFFEIKDTGFIKEYSEGRGKYSGGTLEIIIDNRKCCCHPEIKLKGTKSPQRLIEYVRIERKKQQVNSFFQNLDRILPQIKKCL